MATSLPCHDPIRVELEKIRGGRKVCYFYDLSEGDAPTVNVVPVQNTSNFQIVFKVTGKERHIIHRSKTFENDIREKFEITRKEPGRERKYFKVEYLIKDKALRKRFCKYFEAATPPSSQEDNSS